MKFPCDIDWENIAYKLSRSIGRAVVSRTSTQKLNMSEGENTASALQVARPSPRLNHEAEVVRPGTENICLE